MNMRDEELVALLGRRLTDKTKTISALNEQLSDALLKNHELKQQLKVVTEQLNTIKILRNLQD